MVNIIWVIGLRRVLANLHFSRCTYLRYFCTRWILLLWLSSINKRESYCWSVNRFCRRVPRAKFQYNLCQWRDNKYICIYDRSYFRSISRIAKYITLSLRRSTNLRVTFIGIARDKLCQHCSAQFKWVRIKGFKY